MTTLRLPKKTDITELTDAIRLSAEETGFRYHDDNGRAYLSKELPDYMAADQKQVMSSTSHKFYVHLSGMSSKNGNSKIECYGEAQLVNSMEKLNMPKYIDLTHSRYKADYDKFANAVISHIKPVEVAASGSNFAEKED